MPDRFDLIARKQEVRRLLEQMQQRLEAERAKQPAPHPRVISQLERRLEQLMAEEYTLRVTIDRTRQ
jgi:hypothetical protein